MLCMELAVVKGNPASAMRKNELKRFHGDCLPAWFAAIQKLTAKAAARLQRSQTDRTE